MEAEGTHESPSAAGKEVYHKEDHPYEAEEGSHSSEGRRQEGSAHSLHGMGSPGAEAGSP